MRKQTSHPKGKNAVPKSIKEIPASRTVNISKLKEFVIRNYPPAGYPLQIVFVGEEDVLSAEAFLAKMPLWLKLINFPTRR